MEDSVPSATVRPSGVENTLAPARAFGRREWLVAIALVVAVFLAYQPCWHGGFLWDDESHLLNNPVLQPGGLAKIWVPGAYLNYWPLTYTAYWAQFHLWGLEPLGYHLVNIALHAISALLVWRILVQLRLPGALFAAAIFALHPVNVESVAWIAHLKDVLSVMFALVSVLFYFSYERRGTVWRYGLAIAAFLLSALAKGTAVTLPVVLLACAWWQRGRIERRDLLRVLPYFLIGAVMAGIEMWAQHSVALGDVVRSDGFLSRAAVAGCAVWFYLGKLIWPSDLSPVYPRWNINELSVLSFLPGIMLATILAWAWRQRHTWGRPVLMVIVCYVALLLPALGFVNIYFMRFSLVSDHWQYIATIVPFAVFAGLSATLARRFLRRPAAISASVALLILLAFLSWRQAEIYDDAETFYGAIIDRNPECWLAQNNLGHVLLQRGKIGSAIAHCEKALELKPDYADAQYNLAVALTVRGQDDLAIPHFQRALELKPDDAEAHNNLAVALGARGQIDSAIAHSERALELKPDFAEAHFNLALALVARGKIDSAIVHFQKALAIKPDYVDAEYHLALTLFDHGQVASAVTHFQKALEMKHDSAEAEYHLAIALASRGDVDAAITHFQKALELKHDFAEAHYNLGNILLGRKQFDLAIVHYQKAIEIDPNYVAAHGNLATTLAGRGDDDSAILEYRKALDIKPDYEIARKNLAIVLSAREAVSKTLTEQREAMRLHPNDAARINDVAWTLATNPNESIRHGVEAIQLAGQALQFSGADNPAILGTLAAAYAEAERFPEAVRTGEQAVRLATAAGDTTAAEEYRARLELYKNKEPYRQMPGK